MVEPAPPDTASVPLRARVPTTLRRAIDAVAEQHSLPGARMTRSDALRVLVLEALAARGVSVPA